jgi:hypothetical protein
MPDADTDGVDRERGGAEVAAAAPSPLQLLFAPHPLKLVLLGATTLGAYVWYWLYRNWWAIRVIEQQPRIQPVWRAGLFPLWVCSCLYRLARICGRAPRQAALVAVPATLLFWALLISWFAGPPLAALSLLLGLPLLPANAGMRRYKRGRGLPLSRREGFTLWNWLWLVPVGLLQALGVTLQVLAWATGWPGVR